MRFVATLVGVFLLCAQTSANELDFSFNADALKLQYFHELPANNLTLDAGWLHHTDNGDVVNIGLHLMDEASSGRNRVDAGLGGKFVYTNGDFSGQSGFGFPVGGFVKFTPARMNRLSFRAAAYFAPDILALGDMERYREFDFRVGYNVLRQADVYVGARYARGDYDGQAPDAYFDTGMHIGMSLRF